MKKVSGPQVVTLLRDPSGPWLANNPTPRDLRPALNYRQIAQERDDLRAGYLLHGGFLLSSRTS